MNHFHRAFDFVDGGKIHDNRLRGGGAARDEVRCNRGEPVFAPPEKDEFVAGGGPAPRIGLRDRRRSAKHHDGVGIAHAASVTRRQKSEMMAGSR